MRAQQLRWLLQIAEDCEVLTVNPIAAVEEKVDLRGERQIRVVIDRRRRIAHRTRARIAARILASVFAQPQIKSFRMRLPVGQRARACERRAGSRCVRKGRRFARLRIGHVHQSDALRERRDECGSALDLVLALRQRADPVGKIGLIGTRLLGHGLEFVAKRSDAILIGILHLDLMTRERGKQVIVEDEITGRRKIEHAEERQQPEQHHGERTRHGERSRKGLVGESQPQTIAARPDFTMTGVHHAASTQEERQQHRVKVNICLRISRKPAQAIMPWL